MGFNFPNIREMRQLQEAMLQREKISEMGLSFDIQNSLQQHRRIERALRLAGFKQLQDSRDLHVTLLANQLDVQEAAQEALEQHERIEDLLGDEALEAAMDIAEQRVEASLDANRIAEITELLDRDYFARTLGQAHELLSSNAVTDMLDQEADIQSIIREAEDALDAYSVLEAAEFAGEIAAGPPGWMRHLSRDNLLALVKFLTLYLDTLLALYGMALVFSKVDISNGEVESIIIALRVALSWAIHMLEKSEDDN
jgi:hypothetical protein